MKTFRFLPILSSFSLLAPTAAFALTLKASGTAGMQVAVQQSRNPSAVIIVPFQSSKAVIKTTATGSAFLLKNGQAFGPVVFGYKQGGKIYSYAQARKAGVCKKSSTRAIMAIKAGKAGTKPLALTIKDDLGMGYLTAAPAKAAVDSSSLAKIDALCVPTGARHRLGMPTATSKARALAKASISASCGDASANDKDHDGVPDNFDADNDNNGTVDNDDSQCNDMSQGQAGRESSFWMFSNFHLQFPDSINANMPGMTITKELIDSRLSQYNGLAIQVIGQGQQSVELDCGTLSYCAQGGTGTVAEGPPRPQRPNRPPIPRNCRRDL